MSLPRKSGGRPRGWPLFLRGSTAPLAPSLAEGGLESSGLTGVVKKRALGDIFEEAVAERFPIRAILSQRDGFFDVGVDIFHGPIWMADCCEQGKPDSGSVAVTCEGDDGDSHPEGFAGRRGAIVGKGVERHIDSGVGGEVIGGVVQKAEEFHTVGWNSSGGELFADAG